MMETERRYSMEMITLTPENIKKEHICCAIASEKDPQVHSKKTWLKEQMNNGLIFTKMNVRGKCFIEYLPLEYAWVPIQGENLMYIDCLWVAGKFQGQGYALQLLNSCKQKSIELGKKGIVILSSQKKLSYLMDYHFLVKHGFKSVGTWNGIYELMFCSLSDDAKEPIFAVPEMVDDGLVLYYTHQCPFCVKYVQMLKDYCKEQDIPLQLKHIETLEQAQNAPTPLTTYSLFFNKKFMTREVQSIKRFEKTWSELHG